MKQNAYTKARDQRVADEVDAVDRTLMCPAHGCPNRWTVQGEAGRGCSAHYGADPADWPRITQHLLEAEVDAARRGMRDAPQAELALSREDKLRLLARVRDVHRERPDPFLWARRLHARHVAGQHLNPTQIECYERVLRLAALRSGEGDSVPPLQGFDMPPLVPMAPPLESPPINAYSEELQP
jgi:hypothetical protein